MSYDTQERLVAQGLPHEIAADLARAPRVLGFGDGSDGDVTIPTATTVTLSRPMFYNNLVFTDATSVLATAGYEFFVRGTMSGAGTINHNGAAAVADAAGAAAAAGTLGGGTIGGAGAQAGGSAGAASTPSIGAVGGAGGDGNAVNGAAAGVVTAPLAGIAYALRHVARGQTGWGIKSDNSWARLLGGSGGGGGAGDNAAVKGGGGGGGGGVIMASINQCAFSGTVNAKGGAGGAASVLGGAAGGGGGGGGGAVVLYVGDLLIRPTVDVSGGAGGAKFGAGVAGAAGSTGTELFVSI